MAMPKELAGKSYADMVSSYAGKATATNGTISLPNDRGELRDYPLLTNMHALALFQALRRAAQRAKDAVKLSDYDWELAWHALGWRHWGDRFVMTADAPKGPYPTDLLGVFWDWAADLVSKLDARGTKVAPVPLLYTRSAYEQAARDAWEAMKRLAPEPSVIPPDPGVKPPPGFDDPEKVLPQRPDLSIPWWLLAAAAYFILKDKR
jgi:hypothetical protein